MEPSVLSGTPAKRPRSASALAGLAERVRPQVLAGEELLPLAPALISALGLPGLRRGSTVLVEGVKGLGATSLGLALVGGVTVAGNWCAVLGCRDLGLVAASELGVALDRFVVVGDPGKRTTAVLGALVEVADVLLLGLPIEVSRSELLRLRARARERRVVLVVLGDPENRRAVWPEMPEVSIQVRSSAFFGAGRGSGRLLARRVELETRQRRGELAPRHARLWLPSPEGALLAESPAELEVPALDPELPARTALR